jgi:hypothetical protein
MADVAWNMGLIDEVQRQTVQAMQQQTVDLLDGRLYREARRMSDVVEAYIVQVRRAGPRRAAGPWAAALSRLAG